MQGFMSNIKLEKWEMRVIGILLGIGIVSGGATICYLGYYLYSHLQLVA